MSQRSTVTIAFCDLVGSTALLNRIGEALNDELRRDLFTALRAPLPALGGEEIKTQGDGLMAAFRGRPSDAVACAIAWQQATSALARRDPSLRLALRVGLSTGEATHEEHDWFGTPVVEAARLCSAAAASQILASEAVRLVAGDDAGIAFEPVGELELKGFPERRAAFAVGWEPPATASVVPRPPGLDRAGATAFVGRRAERVACEDALAATAAGTSRTLLIGGAAGAGKTRLVAEVVANTDRTVLAGRWTGLGAHQGSIEALRWFSIAVPADVLRAVLADDAPTLAALVPAIGLRIPELAAAAGTGDDTTVPVDDAIGAFAATFGRIAGLAPVVVVFEDLHAASAAGLALFVELATSRRHGLLLIGTFRTDERGGVPPALAVVLDKLETVPEARRLDLGPLDVADVAGIGASAGLRSFDAAAVHTATDGVAARIVEAVRHLAADDDPDRALSRSLPFKGLVTFDTGDAALFFGRDDTVAAVLGRLANDRIVTVVGTSGSGKSSLARAGVAAAVAAGRIPGRWSTHVMSPGEQPGRALDAVTMPGPGESLLLVVDQLEECITRCDDRHEREAFLDGLTRLVNDPTVDVRVLATVRADLLGAVAVASARFAAAVEVGTFFVGPMRDDELRAAVEGPAEVAGLRLEPGFVDVVVGDVVGQPGALPLLSHALLETWKRRRGPVMTIESYREVGGARGAIARSADTVFESLDADGQAMARELFLRLTEPGDDLGVDDARRRVDRAEAALLGPDDDVRALLELLTSARLVTVDERGIEVAHEALIREWPRLRSWLDESRDALRRDRELRRRAQEWERLGRPDAELLRGARLEQALESSAATTNAVIVAEFLDAGRGLRDREAADTVRRVRRLRAALATAVVLAIVASAAGVVALGQRRRADDRARDAAQQAALAEVRRASAEAVAAADANQPVALPLAVETLTIDDRFETRDALFSVIHADPALIGFLEGPAGGYRSGAISADGTLGAFTHNTGIDLWDLERRTRTATLSADDADAVAFLSDGRVAAATATGVEIWETTDPEPVVQVDFDAISIAPLGAGLVAGSSDGVLARLDRDGRELTRVRTGAGAVRVVSDGASVLVTSSDAPSTIAAVVPSGDAATIDRRDPTTLQVTRAITLVPGDTVTDLVLTPDARTVGVGTSKSVAVFANVDGERALVVDASDGTVAGDSSRVAMVDPTTAITGGVTGAIHGAAGIDARFALQSQVGSVADLIVSPDGTTVWALGIGAQGWSLEIARATGSPTDDAAIVPFALSPDGRYLLAAEDRTTLGTAAPVTDPEAPQVGEAISVTRLVHVLDAATFAPVIEPLGGAPVGFLADSRRVVIISGVLPEIVDLESGERSQLAVVLTSGFGGRAWPISEDGSRLALAQPDGTVHVADPASGDTVATDLGRDDRGLPNLVAYAPDAIAIGYPATASAAPSVVVHRGTDRSTFDIDGPIATALAVSPDAATVAVGGTDGSIRLYDVAGGEIDGTWLVGHTGQVQSVEFRGDGRQLASAATDGTVRIFDLGSRRGLGGPFAAGSQPGARYARSGDTLVVSSPHGPAHIELDPRRWVERACALAGANLSLDAWAQYLPSRAPRATCPQHPAPR